MQIFVLGWSANDSLPGEGSVHMSCRGSGEAWLPSSVDVTNPRDHAATRAVEHSTGELRGEAWWMHTGNVKAIAN